MAVEPFQFIGEKLVQRQSKMLKHKLVEVNAPTFSKTQADMVSEVFLGIGNHTSLVSTQTLLYKLYFISRKYCVAVSLTAHVHARELLNRTCIPWCKTRKTNKGALGNWDYISCS